MCHICGIHPSIQVHTILYSGATAIKSSDIQPVLVVDLNTGNHSAPVLEAKHRWISVILGKEAKKPKLQLCVCSVALVLSNSLQPYSLPGTSVHEIFPGKNIGVGCHFLLQGILPTQGSNLHLLHFRMILYCRNTPGVQITVDLL